MENSEFRREIIISAIKKGYNSFEEILSEGNGIYPSDLKRELKYLVKKGVLIILNNHYFLSKNNVHNILPLPHPLDFDWRFSKEALFNISNQIYKSTANNSTILLLGAPSVFIELTKFLSHRTVVLVEQNSSIISTINNIELPQNFFAFQYNVFFNSNNLFNLINKHLNITFFDYIFFDPPWYLNFYKMFLYQSSLLTKIGTIIQLSLFPICVRPLSYSERWEFFDYCNKLGLSIISLKNNFINYETPIFEKKSLINDGFNTIYNWRFADLLTLTKSHNVNLSKRHLSQLYIDVEKDNWISYYFNGKIIKLKDKKNDKQNPELISIVDNNVLTTVSKRNELRKNVDLWLWDNRVFAVKGNFYFNIALSILSNTKINFFEENIDKEKVTIALNILKDLIQINKF